MNIKTYNAGTFAKIHTLEQLKNALEAWTADIPVIEGKIQKYQDRLAETKDRIWDIKRAIEIKQKRNVHKQPY